MVGRGGLSDCGEEGEVQLSASHPAVLTLCVSFRRLAPPRDDRLRTLTTLLLLSPSKTNKQTKNTQKVAHRGD